MKSVQVLNGENECNAKKIDLRQKERVGKKDFSFLIEVFDSVYSI